MSERYSTRSPEAQAQFETFGASVIDVLYAQGIPVMIGGGYAVDAYSGQRRKTHKDIDLFCPAESLTPALRTAESLGHTTEILYPHWLSKIYQSGNEAVYMDVIHATGNGLIQIDSPWLDRAKPAVIAGRQVVVPPVEEFIAMMASVKEWDRFHGGDILNIFVAQAENIDWDHLLQLFGKEDWPILETHITDFQYIFPTEANRIPRSLKEELIRRRVALLDTTSAEQGSRGRVYSQSEYEPLFETGTFVPTRGKLWKPTG